MTNLLLLAIFLVLIAILLQLSGGFIDPELANLVVVTFEKIITNNFILAILYLALAIKAGKIIYKLIQENFPNVNHKAEKEPEQIIKNGRL